MSASDQAGPSRPTPVRSLRHPALLSVVTRNDAGGLEPPSQSDAVALRAAMQRKVEWRRKGERWMDRFCEETVGKEEFKRGAKYLEHHQYLETLHERHLNSLCSYPLCPNPPAAPYTSKPRFSISVARKAITSKEGNEDEGFCSRVCMVRSGYVGEQLEEGAGVRGGGWRLELLEEIQEGQESAYGTMNTHVSRNPSRTTKQNGAGAIPVSNSPDSASIRTSTALAHPQSIMATPPDQSDQRRSEGKISMLTDSPTNRAASLEKIEQSAVANGNQAITRATSTIRSGSRRPPPSRAAPVPPPPPEAKSQLEDLLANLKIYERPTTSPLVISSASHQPIQPEPEPTPDPRGTTTATTSRAASSLIATPSKLANTLITASRGIGPVPQLAEDSDSDSELSEWEVEMDAFGGLGEEEKRLFEEMREAREMMNS